MQELSAAVHAAVSTELEAAKRCVRAMDARIQALRQPRSQHKAATGELAKVRKVRKKRKKPDEL